MTVEQINNNHTSPQGAAARVKIRNGMKQVKKKKKVWCFNVNANLPNSLI